MNGDDVPLRLRGSDVVAITMARELADGGFDAQLRLVRGGKEWHLTAGEGDGRLTFGFRCAMADMLRDPQGYAESHARKMCQELFLASQERRP